jgi:hypothetical protein
MNGNADIANSVTMVQREDLNASDKGAAPQATT